MTERMVSVVIPVGPGLKVDQVLESLRRVDYPGERIEVIVAEGRNPSRQRNLAAARAKGEIVCFVDDDALLDRRMFRLLLRHFADAKVVVAGGPMMIPDGDALVAKAYGFVWETYLGAAAMRFRHTPIGAAKEATELDLILCNIMMRREVFLAEGGFREDLFPNEENEFFNRLGKKGYKFIYEPGAWVYHRRADTIAKIAWKNVGYGRGRMEQLIVQPYSFKPVFLMPLLFDLYLLSLAFFHPPAYFAPLAAYCVLTFAYGLKYAWQKGEVRLVALMPVIFPVMHCAYGAGFAYGFVRKILGFSGGSKRPDEVQIRELAI